MLSLLKLIVFLILGLPWILLFNLKRTLILLAVPSMKVAVMMWVIIPMYGQVRLMMYSLVFVR